MVDKYVIKKEEHLVDLILNRNDDLPSFTLFLGAGASNNSGVKTAAAMIDIWRNQLYEHEKPSEKYNTWLKKQSWYESDEEYSYLFEELYDEPTQRRDYIEKCMENASPNWGYVYLIRLLEENIFNTVFTTNFDDLLNEACYIYSDHIRPIVCAHDSEVSNIRLARKRPKIIKLHGDFLFDNIKNTKGETQRLEKNMQLKLSQIGQEYGMVFVGYSGRDNSVMSIIEELIKTDDHFKHGIYWCILNGEKPKKRVAKLLGEKRVHAVEISGFDELMALLQKKAGLDLPAAVINPMQVAERRSEIFCSVPTSLRENEYIRHDIERVLDNIAEISEFDINEEISKTGIGLPLMIKGLLMQRKGDDKKALEYFRLAIQDEQDSSICAWEYCNMLVKLNEIKELKDYVIDSPLEEENKTYFLLFADDDNKVIEYATKLISDNPGLLIARINRAIANKRLNKKREMQKDLREIEERNPSISIKAGIAALRKKKALMLELIGEALKENQLSVDEVNIYPVFEDYHGDGDFTQLMEKHKKDSKK